MGSIKENKANREKEELLKELARWDISPCKKKISRSFSFKDFKEAMEFINSVASFSEKKKHYPGVITLRLTKVDIEIHNNREEELSKKDFLLAKEIEDIAGWKGSIEKWISSPKVILFLLILFALLIFWRYFL